MAYTALYRKYRPARFSEVKGQDPIATTLSNQICADRIGHAYLFCGTRGTGKTTVAKIFAKAVNCEHPVDGSPCGECASCRAIASGASMNVIEIDAASNNGVENIRQIREEVSYPPTEGRYKVYIIDEVHMLSIGAFNALLKTLEEPPEYVIFILATTEVHKIPVTILSRCQRYDFRRISIETIAARLADLLKREEVEAEERAIRYVARAADGSMRDALSLMDQCIAFHLGERLTLDRVLDVLGAADTEVFSRLLRTVLAHDVAGAITVLEEMILQGKEPGQFVNDFVWYLRNLLLLKSSADMEEVLDMSAENLALLKEEADMTDDDTILRLIRVFSDLSEQMRFSSQKRVLLEIALIRACRPSMETSPDALADRVAYLEQQMERGVVATPAPEPAAKKAETESKSAPPREPAVPKAVPEDIAGIVQKWPSIVQTFSGRIHTYLNAAHLSLGEGNRLVLVADEEMDYDYLTKEENKREIERAISEHAGGKVEILIRRNDTGLPAQETFPDLQKLVNMKIEVEE